MSVLVVRYTSADTILVNRRIRYVKYNMLVYTGNATTLNIKAVLYENLYRPIYIGYDQTILVIGKIPPLCQPYWYIGVYFMLRSHICQTDACLGPSILTLRNVSNGR